MSVSLVHPLPDGTQTGGFRWRPAFTENGVHVPAMLHNGQDWGAPAGTLIRAAHAGTVSGVFYDAAQGGGWMVRIHAPFGYTMYGHMLRQSPYVKVGDKVSAGQTIGEVGATGLATGTHLHFILNLNGRDVDPMPYLTESLPPKPTPPTRQRKRKAKPMILGVLRNGRGQGVHIWCTWTPGVKGSWWEMGASDDNGSRLESQFGKALSLSKGAFVNTKAEYSK